MVGTTPLQHYLAELERGELTRDPAQRAVAECLEQLYEQLRAPMQATGAGLLGLLSGKTRREPVRGLYLWGGVGRGKSHLVNMFHDTLPFGDKLRIHFHSFMQLVHRELKALGQQRDPLALVAAKIAGHARVICFDEFQVSDITDAMILGRLLNALFSHGVTLVATSNTRPEDLYLGGLQRERFLPAIELIRSHTHVMELETGVDYRLRALERAEIYHHPLDDGAEESLGRCFRGLGPHNVEERRVLDVGGRPIRTQRVADGIAWFDFHELCETARSAPDYIEIARCYHTTLVSDVPCLDDEQRDRVLRFIHLVDELYDRSVNLIVSAAAPPAELYRGDRLAGAFARTRSRLEEMQSREYLARKHIA